MTIKTRNPARYIRTARAAYAGSEIMIDHNTKTESGHQGLWVQAWVLVKDEDIIQETES